MDGEFYVEDSNPRKVFLFVFIMIIVLGGLIYGGYRYKKEKTLTISKKLTFEIGTTLSTNVKDYITNKIVDESKYKLYIGNVDSTKVGTYNFSVKYKNVTKTGKIKIVDTTKPVVETTSLKVGVNETYEADEFISLCEDYSKPCKAKFKSSDDEKLSKNAGTYTVNIEVSDQSNNKTLVTATLVVDASYSREKEKENDLTPISVDPKVDDYNGELIIRYKKAQKEQEHDEEENATDEYKELNEIASDDLHKYLPSEYVNNEIKETIILTAYNKYDYVVGYAIRVKLDNGKFIYLTK